MSKELPQDTLQQDRLRAAPFVGGIWAAVRGTGGLRPANQDYKYLPGVFVPAWLQTLPLPIGENRPARQTVSLGGGQLHFERMSAADEIEEAYEAQPRTRIYESIESRSGGWPAEAARYLMKLAGCDVVCTVYESHAGDETLGPHGDKWYGAIVPILGSKAWQLGEDVGAEEPTVVVEAGDLLLVPQGLLHDVSTPDYSVHMTVAMLVDGYDWMQPEIEAGRIVPVEAGE